MWTLNLDHKTTKRPDEIRVNCPICDSRGEPDGKYRCYINFSKNLFNCYNCGSGGGLGKLKKYIDFGDMGGPVVEMDALKKKVQGLFKKKPGTVIDLDEMSWPLSEEETPLAYAYMRSRGFSDEEIEKYSLRTGRTYRKDDGKLCQKWSGRIIFPFFENDEAVFAVGRSYSGFDPRYLNSEGSKDTVVYGIDRVRGEAIFCEGIISSIAAERVTGIAGIACLGKSLSPTQITKIKNKCNRIFVSLDGTEDVTKEVRNKMNRAFIKAGMEVYEVLLPLGKDPDDLKGDYINYFKKAKRVKI